MRACIGEQQTLTTTTTTMTSNEKTTKKTWRVKSINNNNNNDNCNCRAAFTQRVSTHDVRHNSFIVEIISTQLIATRDQSVNSLLKNRRRTAVKTVSN